MRTPNVAIPFTTVRANEAQRSSSNGLKVGNDPKLYVSKNHVEIPQHQQSVPQAVFEILTQLLGSLIDLMKKFLFEMPAAKADSSRSKGPSLVAKASDQSNLDMLTVPTGASPGVRGGFLWKPESDKDSKVAVLLPPSLTGKVASVEILDPSGARILDRGQYAGNGNGQRDHFRFDKAGSAYPDGAIVLIELRDGTKLQQTITATARRVER